jgi:hypothetical protein
VVTLVFVAVLMATQLSFGRLFALVFSQLGAATSRTWRGILARREDARREKQRREVMAKHVKKGVPAPAGENGDLPVRAHVATAPPTPLRAARREMTDAEEMRDLAAPARATTPVLQKRAPRVDTPVLPLPDPEPIGRAPAERRMGGFTLPPAALLDPPKAERKVDERELMDSAGCSRRRRASFRWKAR